MYLDQETNRYVTSHDFYFISNASRISGEALDLRAEIFHDEVCCYRDEISSAPNMSPKNPFLIPEASDHAVVPPGKF